MYIYDISQEVSCRVIYVYQTVSEGYLILSSESCLGTDLSVHVQFIVLQFQRLIVSHSFSFSVPLSLKHTLTRTRGPVSGGPTSQRLLASMSIIT